MTAEYFLQNQDSRINDNRVLSSLRIKLGVKSNTEPFSYSTKTGKVDKTWVDSVQQMKKNFLKKYFGWVIPAQYFLRKSK